MTIALEIERPGAQMIRYRLPELGQTTIGRAPHHGVAVPDVPELSAEHLLVEPTDQGCRVLVLPGTSLPARFRGNRFEDGLVPFDETLIIGPLQLRFRRRSSGSPSPIVVGGLLAIAVLLLLMIFGEPVPLPIGGPMPEAPQLELAAPDCPEGDLAPAAHAEELEAQALASAERYPFAVSDGVHAVAYFGAAAACYATARDPEGAQRSRQAQHAWMNRLRERYLAHRLRLRVALDRGQLRVALQQLPVLMELLQAQQEHPYARWLTSVQAQLAAASEES